MRITPKMELISLCIMQQAMIGRVPFAQPTQAIYLSEMQSKCQDTRVAVAT